MENFTTGYAYIDERLINVKKQLPEDLQKELDYAVKRVHSLGVHEGYNAGLDGKEAYQSDTKK
jgi:hypothetical protein